jgi:hypothetical protein
MVYFSYDTKNDYDHFGFGTFSTFLRMLILVAVMVGIEVFDIRCIQDMILGVKRFREYE